MEQAARQLAKCANSPPEHLVLPNTLALLRSQIERINACSTLACLQRRGARLGRLVDEQKPIVDRAVGEDPRCGQAALIPLDRGLAAYKRLAAAVQSGRGGGTIAAAEAQRLFTEVDRTFVHCDH